MVDKGDAHAALETEQRTTVGQCNKHVGHTLVHLPWFIIICQPVYTTVLPLLHTRRFAVSVEEKCSSAALDLNLLLDIQPLPMGYHGSCHLIKIYAAGSEPDISQRSISVLEFVPH